MTTGWDNCEKCCANCTHYRKDFSVDAAWCNKDDAGDWVKQRYTDDSWDPDYDFCMDYTNVEEDYV